jgi:hypothetical protein
MGEAESRKFRQCQFCYDIYFVAEEARPQVGRVRSIQPTRGKSALAQLSLNVSTHQDTSSLSHNRHDRAALRNLEREGVPRSVAMKLTGHKTESVYRRYAMADDRDLRVAVERLDALSRR